MADMLMRSLQADEGPLIVDNITDTKTNHIAGNAAEN